MNWRKVICACAAVGIVVLAGGCGSSSPNKPADTPPTACFSATPASGTNQISFQFDASCSTDLQDQQESLQTRWDWETDGTWDTEYSTTKTASHSFATVGTKTITVEVKDTEGQTNSTTRQVTVTSGAPHASFTVDPAEGTLQTTFQFDASGCTDAEDPTSALEVRWDWDGDGVWDTSYSTTKTASHQYTETGMKTATLEVRDTGGLTNGTTRQVSILNTSPSASFTVEPASGTEQTLFQFDASGCTDLEDPVSVLEVRWDWENDGTWDTAYSTTKTASHQYASTGTKTVKMEVKDTGGLADAQTHDVTVSLAIHP